MVYCCVLYSNAAWVDEAFGPFWAFQKGWLSWLSGVSDNTLYPILFLDCMVQLISTPDHPSMLAADGGHPFVRMSFIMSITISLTYLNYREYTADVVVIYVCSHIVYVVVAGGLDIVGNVAIVICLVSLMPFVVFCVLGAAKVQPARWLVGPELGIAGVNWRLLLNTFFWNINYWVSSHCQFVA